MILNGTPFSYQGMFSFASSGGAVGSYDLQIPLPGNAIFLQVGAICVAPVTSGTSTATVSLDIIQKDVLPNVTTIAGFGPAFIAPVIFNAAGVVLMTMYPGGTGPTALPPIKLFPHVPGDQGYSYSIGVSIGVEAITGGSFQVLANGIIFDF